MGGACSSDSDGAAYQTSIDRSGTRLNPEATAALVHEKLRHSLFSGLMSQAQLADFSRHFQLRHYPANSVLVKKGSSLDALYVVGEGKVRMEVDEAASPGGGGNGPGGGGGGTNNSSGGGGNSGTGASAPGKKLLCVKNVGEFFGEGMIMLEGGRGGGGSGGGNSGPSSTVHDLNAVTPADEGCLLLVLPRSAYASFVRASPEMGPVCRSLALGMEKQLAQLDFFRGVAPVQMKMLVTMFHFVPLVQGDTLFRENDFDREMGNSLYFLYKGRVRVTNTEKKKAHAHELASHASETTAGGGAALASSAAAGVSSSASPPGSPLQSGLAGPPAEEEKTLNILEPGCFFGEVGLLLDIPRTATIVAEDSSLLLELSQKNFRHFITIVPDMLTKFNTVLLEYNIHLRWFLANPLVLSYFITHCKAEFSTENIEFWMACREFRKFVESGEASNQAAIDARAMEIKAKYIGAQAEHQVNLKGSVESKLLRSLASGSGNGVGGTPISATVFVDAEEEILGLMSSDSFGRFKSSELFKSCIETVNSPYTAILRKLFLI